VGDQSEESNLIWLPARLLHQLILKQMNEQRSHLEHVSLLQLLYPLEWEEKEFLIFQ